METLTVVWHKKARAALHKQAMWYLFNCSQSYVDTFITNVENAVSAASRMPTIDRYKKISSNKTYRELLTHPKSKIVYWYDYKEIHILNIVFSDTNY